MNRFFPGLMRALLIAGLFSFSLNGQLPVRCHADQKMAEALANDPNYASLFDQYGNAIGLKNMPEQVTTNVVTIPVHVIIVHPPGQPVGSGANLSLERIESQIDVLNEDFRRLNSDAVNTPPEFPAADPEIEFCLAAFDPNGNPTDGVTRYPTSLNLDNNEFQIKQATTWDRNNYLNIWVGPLNNLLGWAYLPTPNGLPNATLDGVVVETESFGGPGYATLFPYDLGRTATHEVGHYLGLRHMWGNGGCNSDDNLTDTPPSSSPYFGCPSHPQVSCNSNDMFMNYMDYVDDNCMNSFTEDQGDYMHVILNSSRSSLLSAANTYCTVIQGLSITLIQAVDPGCYGDMSGVIEVEAAGGVPPYTYELDGVVSQPTGLFTGLAAGLHIIAVTDNIGNQEILQVTLEEPDPLVLFENNQVEPLCFDSNDGILSLETTGGTPPYLFSLNGSPPQSSPDFFNLGGGFYLASVIDANNCQTNLDVIFSAPDPLVILSTMTSNVTCFGDDDGTVTVTVGGGTPGYSYSLDGLNFQSNGSFTNVAAGIYDVLVQDANQCELVIAGLEVTQPDSLTLEIIELASIQCHGEASASVGLFAEGGTEPYLYQQGGMPWQTESQFNDLPSGGYSWAVEDVNGCLAAGSTFIFQPDTLVVDSLLQVNPTCGSDSSGSIFISFIGGVPPYQYFLNGDSIGSSTGLFEGLAEGVYTVGGEDANQCQIEVLVTLVKPGNLPLSLESVTSVTCFGGADGSISIMPPVDTSLLLSYSLNGGDFQTDLLFSGLSSGTYSLLVQDAEGCSSDTLIQVVQPDSLFLVLDSLWLPECAGTATGGIQLTAFGGNDTLYTYSLEGEGNLSGLFENLPAGDYIIEVIDGSGCSSEIAVSLDEPQPLEIISVDIANAGCPGENQGQIGITAAGGTGIKTYFLDNQSNETGLFDSLEAGVYFIEVVDENGCTITWEGEVPGSEVFKIEETIVNKISCYAGSDGIIELSAQGSGGEYTYSWQGETNSSGIFDSLPAGIYEFTITDDQGCSQMASVELIQPTQLQLKPTLVSSPGCAGAEDGIILLDASGGTGSLIFSLNDTLQNQDGQFFELPEGAWVAAVTDNNGCVADSLLILTDPLPLSILSLEVVPASCYEATDGTVLVDITGGGAPYTFSLGDMENETGFFEGLSGGDYLLEVTDSNNCLFQEMVIIDEPEPLQLVLVAELPANCGTNENGSIQVSAAGGNGEFQYSLGSTSNSSGVFNDLGSGNYLIKVVDKNGCATTEEFAVSDVGSLDPFVLTLIPETCKGANNASIQLDTDGGSGNFSWQFGNEMNETGFFDNLAPGIWDVQVSDTTGCSGSMIVEIPMGPQLMGLITEFEQPTCFGLSDGSVGLDVDGGSGSYLFELNGEMNSNGSFTGLSAGSYDALITDSLGCFTVLTIEMTEPSELLFTIPFIEPVSCNGFSDGSIQTGAFGGTGSYVFDLNGSQNDTGFFDSLPAGDYELFLTDQNGCSTSLAFDIFQPDSINIGLTFSDISCFGGNDGLVEVTATGGTGDFTYLLDSVSSSSGTFDGLSAGMYELVAQDAAGCVVTQSVELVEPEALVVMGTVIQQDMGLGNGIVALQGTGGVPPYQYALNNGPLQTDSVFFNLEAGFYTLSITDANGCIQMTEVEVLLETAILAPGTENIGIHFFPNPFGNSLHLQTNENLAGEATIKLIDARGIEVFREKIYLSNGIQTYPVGVSKANLPAGWYLAKIRIGQDEYSIPLVKAIR